MMMMTVLGVLGVIRLVVLMGVVGVLDQHHYQISIAVCSSCCQFNHGLKINIIIVSMYAGDQKY